MTTGNLPAREFVRIIGGLLDPSRENIGRYLERVSVSTGLPVRLVEAAWHRETVSRNTFEILRRAVEKINNEARDTADRLEQMANRLEILDPEFHRQDIEALRTLACRHRNLAGRK